MIARGASGAIARAAGRSDASGTRDADATGTAGTDRRAERSPTIAVVDNYDSFTWNLVQYLRELGAEVRVHRNDAIDLETLSASDPDAVLISPGPGTPDQAGVSLGCVERFAGRVPLLGVCLGHQSIGQRYGGRIARAREVMHGKLSLVHHRGEGVFAGLPSPFRATRYHSLVIAPESIPDALEVTAWTEDERGARVEIMGVRHREHAIEGVQFHPESIESEHGHALLGNFLARVEAGGG